MEAAEVKGLLGLLLVDGSLNQYRTPRGGYVQLTLTGGITESAFLEDKVAEFRQFIPTEAQIVPYKAHPRVSEKPNAQGVVDETTKHTTVLRFRVSTNKLRPVYNLLYPSGKRKITQQVLDLLGAAAAAWAWAEGARPGKDGSAVLARCGTTDSEGLLMSRWIEMLTGATSTLCKEVGEGRKWVKPRLEFTPEQAVKVRTALEPYAPPSRLHLFKAPNDSQADQDSTGLVSGQRELEHSGKQAEAVA